MDLKIVNPQSRYGRVRLIEPPALGYIQVAAAVEPPARGRCQAGARRSGRCWPT
jgi:hypothetical protein